MDSGPPRDSPDAFQAARLLPRQAALGGASVVPVRTEHERAQALLALARWPADCTRRGCLAFVLDDLQFADGTSLAALRLLAEPAEARVTASGGTDGAGPVPAARTALRFAFGLRSDEAGAEVQPLLASLADTGRWTRIDLAPLSADEAYTLLHCLGLPALAADTWAAPLWRQVGATRPFCWNRSNCCCPPVATMSTPPVARCRCRQALRR